MRKAIVFLLLASAAAPAFASADPGDRRDRRSEQADRAERAERSERAERPQRAERDNDDNGQSQRAQRAAAAQRAAVEQSRAARDDRHQVQRQQLPERRIVRDGTSPAAGFVTRSRARAAERSDAPGSVTNWRGRERHSATSPAVVQERNRNGVERLRARTAANRAPAVSRVPREGTQPPLRSAVRVRRDAAHHWSSNWRSDRRYDWRSHRRRYSSLFNFGFYRDPFGWGYRPFSIGWRMWPSYYGSSYWLNDPYQYRLPYAPPGYRWVRYYDDAILVDTWDGQVVDVIRNFFW
jgi:hypothetical protein